MRQQFSEREVELKTQILQSVIEAIRVKKDYLLMAEVPKRERRSAIDLNSDL
jgi:hypothetical protein